MITPENPADLVVDAALALPTRERGAYLDKACTGDLGLRSLVEALLRAHEHALVLNPRPWSLDCQGPACPVAVSLPDAAKPGDRIGRYKLLQQIGEGGCGLVYLAEQEQPVRRRVALKVIKLGMDTKQVIGRFEAERQALALMDHPNIAKVLDAGADETGRPYFVMELVRGIKITDYCDQHNLPTAERLKLFIQICRAIQHAHQKGIIHRDIKPSNILVTLHDGLPVPKVIDFGIAKATQQDLTDNPLRTAFQQFVGTPAYMSPEQAEMSGLDIDTRSDIYSLGVLLYELLTGQMPFDPKHMVKAGLDEMRRIVREEDPPRPSTRLSNLEAGDQTMVAKRRAVELPRLLHQIRGDLDWIVMKCLEKERTRRYETANGIANEIERFLSDEPVIARPPSNLYRFQKLVRRNKLVFAAASAVGAALIVGLGAATWLLLREKHARERAVAAETMSEREATRNQQVAEFLKGMLKRVDPGMALGRDATMVRDILDETAERVAKDLEGQPEIEAELRSILGNTYYGLGDYAKAEEMHREALRLRRNALGGTNQFVAASLTDLGNAMAMEQLQPEAEMLQREAVAMLRKLFGGEDARVAKSISSLADTLTDEYKLEEAEGLQREALAVQRRMLPADHPDVATSLNNLGRVLRREQRFAETEPIYREALALTRRWPSAGNRFLADALFRLGKVLHQQGKLTETADVWREALAIRTKLLGAENPEVSVVRNSLAGVLCEQGGPLQAETLYRELLRDLRNRLPSDDPRLASALVPLTRRLLSEEKFAEAEPPARECLAIWEKKNPDAWETFNLRSLLGESLLGQKRYGEAEPLLLSGCAGMKQREANISSPNRAYLRQSLQGIVRLYESIGRTEAASEWRKELSAWHREQIEQYRKPAELGDVESLKWLAWLLATCESSEVRDGQAAMRHAEKLVAVTRRQNFACLGTLAAAYAEAGEFAKAVAAQGEALALGPEGKIKENYASRLRLYEAKLPYRDRSRESDL